ncbi:MAG TPA: LptF/LptG family permease [Phycisphaerae bacterium]
MIYRTLHTYILRQLLRVFVMTALALTTLMAFGGTFRPLTKQGIDIRDLLVILLNMMPAMLAYAIPIAALFAAVLVYWRMSTDNELTACRAGGISFSSMVFPALVLGLLVASIDLLFVNYVVPLYLQKTERAVRRDLGSLIVSQISRQEKFQTDLLPMVVSADRAELLPSTNPEESIVVLHGMAAALLDKNTGKQTYMALAEEAIVKIKNIPEQDAADITFDLHNSTGFDPSHAFDKVSMSLNSIVWNGKPFHVPSQLRTRPKFLNLDDLKIIRRDPYAFPRITEMTDRIEVVWDYEQVSQIMLEEFKNNSGHLTFDQASSDAGRGQVTLTAPRAEYNPTGPAGESLTFKGTDPSPAAPAEGKVRVQQFVGGKLANTYTCDAADLVISFEQFTGRLATSLRLHDPVLTENTLTGGKRTEHLPVNLPVEIDVNMLKKRFDELDAKFWPDPDKKRDVLVSLALESPRKEVRKLGQDVVAGKVLLNQQIDSELHSRGSFALSCLTLVLFGAALGILLRGKNPLAVFVIGFVPAVFLVLLITAGREVTEGNARNVTTGITLIWAGNALLLVLVAGVYLKLLRR